MRHLTSLILGLAGIAQLAVGFICATFPAPGDPNPGILFGTAIATMLVALLRSRTE